MHLTNVLLKKAKAKYVMILLRSTGSSHTVVSFRERLAPKKELITFDPHVEMECVYKEERKLKSIRFNLKLTPHYSERTYDTVLK